MEAVLPPILELRLWLRLYPLNFIGVRCEEYTSHHEPRLGCLRGYGGFDAEKQGTYAWHILVHRVSGSSIVTSSYDAVGSVYHMTVCL